MVFIGHSFGGIVIEEASNLVVLDGVRDRLIEAVRLLSWRLEGKMNHNIRMFELLLLGLSFLELRMMDLTPLP
jgi:hypothetical protein